MVINTSSANGGLFSLPTTPIYAATKAAVTSVTEVLHYQFLMDKAKLKAAILFPGPNVVNTRILDSNRNRPAEFSDGSDNKPHTYKSMRELVEATGLKMQLTEPEDVASFAVESVKADRFWMLPDSSAHDAAIRGRAEIIVGRNGLALPPDGLKPPFRPLPQLRRPEKRVSMGGSGIRAFRSRANILFTVRKPGVSMNPIYFCNYRICGRSCLYAR